MLNSYGVGSLSQDYNDHAAYWLERCPTNDPEALLKEILQKVWEICPKAQHIYASLEPEAKSYTAKLKDDKISVH